ncbi:hypothetical protein Tco_0394803, partial [Tanacetum coccineum]
FLVYLDGIEPYLLKILENGPFMPKSSLSSSTYILHKPQKQWSHEDRRLDNQDKRLKSIIKSCLLNDVMKSIIKCITTKAIWIDLIIAHKGQSDTRDTKIAALRLKFNAFKGLEGKKVNGTFTRKWLSMNQTQRANNSIRNDILVTLYGKYNYKEGLIDQIYKLETRAAVKFLVDLHAAFHERAILTNQKRFYKRSGRIGSAKKSMDKSNETYFAYGKLVPGNIVPALGGRGKRKETISSKEVVFTKADGSSSETILEITFDSESECDD